MKMGSVDPRKPILGTVTFQPFGPILILMLVILISMACTMIFTGRMSTKDQEFEAKLHEKAKDVALQEQRLDRARSELREEMGGRGKQQEQKEAAEAAAAAAEAEAPEVH